MKYYSQNGEDFILSKMFGDKRDGFFVEVGCIDGRRFSNTLAFEEMGWKGLCVEAHADFVGFIRNNRPGSIVAHCAAGASDEDEVVFYANERGSLSTLDRSKETHFREHYGAYFKGFEKQSVPKRRLDTLFRENGIEKIDILSIDIEGTEAEALSGIDFRRYRPAVVVVEADDPEEERDIDKILIPSGYNKSFRIHANLFYLLDPVMAMPVKNGRYEVSLTHTRHPLDECCDQEIKVLMDAVNGNIEVSRPESLKKSSMTYLSRLIRKALKKITDMGKSGKAAGKRADQRFVFFETGFHGDRYLLDLVDTVAKNCDCFIETGTNVGSTLSYMARTYPRISCISCEPDSAAYGQSQKNTSGLGNVTLYNETSQEFILRLKERHGGALGGETMFWLDAHGYGFRWPLKDELAFITSEFRSGYIFIDDFKVPGLDCFKYDVYEGQICSFEFVKDAMSPGIEYRIYYPDYTDVTSKHHPLCGWGLIEFGHAEELTLPDSLAGKVRRPERVRL